MRCYRFKKHADAGFSLIEVLVSALILGLGFLGLSAMQSYNLKTNHSAFQRSQAVMLANFMMDAMRANKEAATNGDYDLGSLSGGDNPVCVSPSGSRLVDNDLQLWFNAMQQNLGNNSATCGLIVCDAEDCIVKVFWDDSRAGGLPEQQVEIVSQL